MNAERSGKATANNMSIYYEDFGPADAPAVMLVMGLSAQLTLWREELINELLAAGFRVIRFDNRDIGLSSKGDKGIRPNIPLSYFKAKVGWPIKANYTLHDMAADTVGLADALGIKQFHIAGVSMGGMISQLVSAHYPERVLSLISIMSSTNHPRIAQPRPDVLLRMIGRASSHDEDDVVMRSLQTWNLIAGPVHKPDQNRLEERLRSDYKRSYRPSGIIRQTHAIAATGSIESYTKKIKAPTLVIHGDVDPLVRHEGGRRTARLIKNAVFRTVEGMGHDFPDAIVEDVASWMSEHVLRAQRLSETELA